MLNIVIPMAGAGRRFAEAGYALPKPMIPVRGVPIIKLVIRNLKPSCPHKFIFVCQRGHLNSYRLASLLSDWAPGSEVIALDGLTDGAACTVLAAREFIDSNHDQLMIANCDQWIDINIDDYLSAMTKEESDGFIMTMQASDPKWSFVGFNELGSVQCVVEKQVISNEATVGIYNFRCGRDFVVSAELMISKNIRVNGEFYVAPTYNFLIESGKRVGVYNIGEVGKGMYGLGTPDDLDAFLKMPVLARALGDQYD